MRNNHNNNEITMSSIDYHTGGKCLGKDVLPLAGSLEGLERDNTLQLGECYPLLATHDSSTGSSANSTVSKNIES